MIYIINTLPPHKKKTIQKCLQLHVTQTSEMVLHYNWHYNINIPRTYVYGFLLI